MEAALTDHFGDNLGVLKHCFFQLCSPWRGWSPLQGSIRKGQDKW